MATRTALPAATNQQIADNMLSKIGHLAMSREEVFDFWDKLSDLAAPKSDAGLHLCLERISHWINARNAFWAGIVRVQTDPSTESTDPTRGWRIRAYYHMYAQHHDPAVTARVLRTDDYRTGVGPGLAQRALAAGVGTFRAYTLQGGRLIDPQAFQQTEHFDLLYRRWGIADRIWVGIPVSADAESFFCFDRMRGGEFFNDEELNLAAFALRGIKWFHRQALLGYGLGLCENPVTVAERGVIQCLLSGASEQEIAAELGLTHGTVHQYATRIYRKFGVRGRAQFTAIWLKGRF